jgi:hypothetical protein
LPALKLPAIENQKSWEPSAAKASGAPQPRQTILLHWIVILLAAVIATRSMWEPALLYGHSSWFDLARMVEFDAAMRAGNYFPVWSPDFYFGHGSPIFQFYSPLCYYLAEIPVLAGLHFSTALKVAQGFALFASGMAMYRLACAHLSGWAACLGGVLYMIAPYRLVDMYVRHAFAEHCAFIWLPLIVWGTERFISTGSRASLATGLWATAGLVLTHNVMALIALPVCVAAGWALAAPKRWPASLLLAGEPALLGIGISAFFWWPAISGRPLTRAKESLTGGYFDFHRHFVNAWSFIDFTWGFGESGNAAGEKMSLQIGLPHLVAGIAALAWLFGKWGSADKQRARRRRWGFVAIATMFGAMILCSRLSQPLWEALPMLKYAQFPWRFLGLAVFGAAMCGALVADHIGTRSRRSELIAFSIGLIAVMGAYFPYYSQARYLVADARTKAVLPVTVAQMDALDAVGALIPIGRSITTADIRAAGERATSSDDFLPRGVAQKPAQPPAEAILAHPGQVRRLARHGMNDYQAQIGMTAPGEVELQQFWFPGWVAMVDGHETNAFPSGPHAVVSCKAPAGDHLVEFRYDGLPQRRAGLAISAFSGALAALAILGAGHSLWEKKGSAA